MAILHFRKQLVSNRVYVNGKPVRFEVLPGNRGVLAIDPEKEADACAALNRMADEKKLGVTRMTQAEYEEFKKKASLKKSARISDRQPNIRAAKAPSPFGKPSGGIGNPVDARAAAIAPVVARSVSGRSSRPVKPATQPAIKGAANIAAVVRPKGAFKPAVKPMPAPGAG